MSKYEILEAFCELENSKGEISDADFKEFALKNNLIEWEGDFSDDLYKHRFLKELYPKIATKEYSQQLEKSYYGPPNEEKEKKRQELKNKGFSDKEISDYLLKQKIDDFNSDLSRTIKELEEGLLDEEFDYGEGFSGKLLKLWDKLFGK